MAEEKKPDGMFASGMDAGFVRDGSYVRVGEEKPLAEDFAPSGKTPKRGGVKIKEYFTQDNGVYDTVDWEQRSAKIVNPATGEEVFRADNLEFPKHWSQNCTAIVAEKYFRYVLQSDGTKVRENSVQQMISRVAGTIAKWGRKMHYFDEENAKLFAGELSFILLHQMAAFNSPVWFNIGTTGGELGTEQCSACFINSLDDNMGSILELSKTEGILYKSGSGSGVNYSNLRSSRESLSGGGYASGPVPFIMKDDFNAGAVKSGGTTRRAAKMAILNIDHGDILEFIQCKAKGEQAAHVLIDSGVFSGDFRDRWGAYAMVPFQNANHSVRVTEEFMNAVEHDETWTLKARDGTGLQIVKARTLWDEICKAAWQCGDPGLQFDTTINDWHTCPESGRINSSNPCSEYMHLDDSACNLASINLMKFMVEEDGVPVLFDHAAIRHTVDILTIAMDIIVGGAKYPTEKIASNSHKFRQLGIGFTNLGACFMAQGIPYSSLEASTQAALLMGLITGRAYNTSSYLAEVMGPFEGYKENEAAMLRVIKNHKLALIHAPVRKFKLPATYKDSEIVASLKVAAFDDWTSALKRGMQFGFRNSQATVVAPAGTISFLMDCDTTGIEPDLSLKKTKKLVGGGTMQIVNRQVPMALKKMGYGEDQIKDIVAYVDRTGSVVDAPHLDPDYYAVFDTSFPDPIGGRAISPISHVHMMAAVQPFVSGAISKTCNLPNDATEKDVSMLYMEARELGLKAIAIYRDGCKRTQPLSSENTKEVESETAPAPLQVRKKLPTDCLAHRHHFKIGQHAGYLHVGMYPDGQPGELFIQMAKEGSTVSGLMDAIGVLTSIALQYGVPLPVLVEKFSYTQFEPSGFTENPDIRMAQSPLDYIFRFLGKEFLEQEPQESAETPVIETVNTASEIKNLNKSSGQVCSNCGNGMQRAGSCLTCSTCGSTSGCG